MSFEKSPMQAVSHPVQKYPIKRLEPSVSKFLKVLEIDLDRLQRHRLNMEKLLSQENWKGLNKEQINASRTIQQIKANIREIEKARGQIVEEDLAKFDDKVECMKEKAVQSIKAFVTETLPTNSDSCSSSPTTPSCPSADITSTSLPSSLGNHQVQLHVVPHNTEAAASWENLQENLVELNEMIHEFASMVDHQGDQLDHIEDNIDKAQHDVNAGALSLGKAAKYKAVIFPVVGAVIGGVVAGPVGAIAAAKLGGVVGVAAGGVAGHSQVYRRPSIRRLQAFTRQIKEFSPTIQQLKKTFRERSLIRRLLLLGSVKIRFGPTGSSLTVVGRLGYYWENWRILQDDYVLQVLREGYEIQLKATPPLTSHHRTGGPKFSVWFRLALITPELSPVARVARRLNVSSGSDLQRSTAAAHFSYFCALIFKTNNPQVLIRLPRELRPIPRWWLKRTECLPGVSLVPFSPTHQLFVGASLEG
ncbi:syntaxin-17-like [Haliotis rubra]|uniref:syntaxin-17-like n=1 Tax=Haliotis rubra TaxID=36100 RepID=UPI001EE62A0C|nr:syntaxin-17-like [Haliotis rubra]